jgi:hypothetical protein
MQNILKCSAFSPNSAFGNAEFENTVSAERTLIVLISITTALLAPRNTHLTDVDSFT